MLLIKMYRIRFLLFTFGIMLILSCNDKSGTAEDSKQKSSKSNTAEKNDLPEEKVEYLNISEIETDSINPPVISFDEEHFDFGEITDGAIIEHDFNFKNTGKAPLIIHDVRSSCGCTIPEKPKDPVLPGETGKISVVFNSKGKGGSEQKVFKRIYIIANTYPEVGSSVSIGGYVK